MPRIASSGVDTFVHSFLQGGDFANNWALISGTEKTHLYNIYSLYSKFFKGTVLNSSDDFGDVVNVYSVKNESDTNVFFVNKDNKPHTSSLSFQRGESLDDITTITLPAWSMTVISVSKDQSDFIKIQQYGAREMGILVE
jgi:hypothetical protein